MLRTEVSDPNSLLKGHAGRDYLGENSLEMGIRKWATIMTRDAIEHRALASRLMDRRTVGVREPADLKRDLCTFGEEIDKRMVDTVDPLAQIDQIRAGLRRFCRSGSSHCAGIANGICQAFQRNRSFES
jgi:hypothetical protein